MTPIKVEIPEAESFSPGEKVYVCQGVYQGTLGHFVALRPDTNWAEVREDVKERVLTHPVEWLRHCPDGELDWTKLLERAH